MAKPEIGRQPSHFIYSNVVTADLNTASAFPIAQTASNLGSSPAWKNAPLPHWTNMPLIYLRQVFNAGRHVAYDLQISTRRIEAKPRSTAG